MDRRGTARVRGWITAVLHLASAVWKFPANQPPMRLNDTTRTYFERLATISTPEEAVPLQPHHRPGATADIERYFAEHELTHYSILRTSVVPTIIQGGFRSNVIPSEAEATLDIRALPDEDMPKFYAWLQQLINDPAIEIVPAQRGPASRACLRASTMKCSIRSRLRSGKCIRGRSPCRPC